MNNKINYAINTVPVNQYLTGNERGREGYVPMLDCPLHHPRRDQNEMPAEKTHSLAAMTETPASGEREKGQEGESEGERAKVRGSEGGITE